MLKVEMENKLAAILCTAGMVGLTYVLTKKKTWSGKRQRDLHNGLECCATEAFSHINAKLRGKKPKIGIICGSGLGGMTDLVKDAVEFQYHEVPGFPISSVKGHGGKLIIGEICGVCVAMFKGRVHLYEGIDPKKTRVLIYTLKLLGCEELILSSAVGSCRKEFGPGSVVLVKDHINNQGVNPLCGRNDPIGPRFVGMREAYDKDMRSLFKKAAKDLNIVVGEGVYHAALGPAFESPAEVNAYRIMGADLLGMSVVGETLCARHCGLRVAALGVVVNYACSLDEEEPSHKETLEQAAKATPKCIALVKRYLEVHTVKGKGSTEGQRRSTDV